MSELEIIQPNLLPLQKGKLRLREQKSLARAQSQATQLGLLSLEE